MAPPQRYVTNLLPFVFETFEKWLRRASKIFSAKKTTRRNHDA